MTLFGLFATFFCFMWYFIYLYVCVILCLVQETNDFICLIGDLF